MVNEAGDRPSPLRWWICGVLLLATTLNYMDRISLNQMSKEIKNAYAIGNTAYGVLESGFQIAFGIGAVLFGIIVDRFGPYRVYPVAVVGWSAAGFLTGFADSYWTLFGCRMMLGIFEAGNWPCGIRTVRQVMTRDERSLGNSIFQSGTGLGAIVTPLAIGACFWYFGTNAAEGWRIPFRVIGVIGLAWVVLWLLTVPRRLVNGPAANPASTTDAEPFSAVFRDRRFWILIAVIIGVNTSWHTFRVWQPLFFRESLGYSEVESRRFNMLYFIVADVGSWLAGFAVIGLKWRGFNLHASRMIVFAISVLFVMAAFAIPFVAKDTIPVLVLVSGFGGLGLFATYFAFSQELSGKNQGKVTGTLGCVNSLYLAGLYWVQGAASDYVGSLENVLATAPIPAIVAFVAVVIWWPREKAGGV
jgi:ACS family hexuronate transporter-like MFS transporter